MSYFESAKRSSVGRRTTDSGVSVTVDNCNKSIREATSGARTCPERLHTPNAEFVVEIMKARNLLLRQFPEHIAVRNAEDNRRFLERAGFVDVSVHFLPHYNILSLVHPMSFIPLIGKYFQARIFIVATKGGG